MNPPPANGPVLIVEDEKNIAALVATYLERAGFETLSAHDGRRALELLPRRPALIILDIMLPRMDGWELCREIRKSSEVPILILTAQEEEVDRVLGFSLGADDYVVKPFSPRELVARVKAILRRAGSESGRTSGTFRRGGLVLDPEKHKVTLDGDPVALTPSEYTLLHALMGSPGRVFSREELLSRLYPNPEAVVDRVVDVHIGKLRQKIEADSSRPELILTVRGVGYRFTDAERP